MEYLRKAQHLRRCFHRSAHRQGSSLRSQPCPIKSKSPTGIVAHATGLYFPRGMQPYAGDLYGDCRTRNWAARNIPRGMQPHADDLYGDCRTRNRAARNVPRCIQPGDTRSPTCISPMRIYRLSFLLPIKFILETLNIGIVQESSEFIRG